MLSAIFVFAVFRNRKFSDKDFQFRGRWQKKHGFLQPNAKKQRLMIRKK